MTTFQCILRLLSVLNLNAINNDSLLHEENVYQSKNINYYFAINQKGLNLLIGNTHLY